MSTLPSLAIKYDTEVTVVLATIGEETLLETLKSILHGSIVPYRLLLCIPDELAERVNHLSKVYESVEVVPTVQRGQVIQRIVGFKKSISKYTLQLDSDVIVDKYLIEKLKYRLKKEPGTCIGPVLYSQSNGKPYSFLSDDCVLYKSFQKKTIAWILNGSEGYQSGSISKGGIGFGPNNTANNNNAEWLPGCCIMHETNNLILENFYFWYGKAYSEDLYHSHHIRKKRVRMIYDGEAKLYVNFPDSSSMDWRAIIKEQWKHLRATLGFVSLDNKSKFRFLLYKVINATFLLNNKFFR